MGGATEKASKARQPVNAYFAEASQGWQASQSKQVRGEPVEACKQPVKASKQPVKAVEPMKATG